MVIAVGFALARFADAAAPVRGQDDEQAEGFTTAHEPWLVAGSAADAGRATAAAAALAPEHDPGLQFGPHAGWA